MGPVRVSGVRADPRALSAFLGEVRDRPLYAGVAEHNHASIRVLEKCGFRVSDEDVGPSDRAEPAFLVLKLTEAGSSGQRPSARPSDQRAFDPARPRRRLVD